MAPLIVPLELTLYTGTPPSLISIIFWSHPSGQGIPSLSKFFENVIRLGSLVNIQLAPKKVKYFDYADFGLNIGGKNEK